MSEKEDVTLNLTKIESVTSTIGLDVRTLVDDELDAVNGGVVIAIISVWVG